MKILSRLFLKGVFRFVLIRSFLRNFICPDRDETALPLRYIIFCLHEKAQPESVFPLAALDRTSSLI